MCLAIALTALFIFEETGNFEFILQGIREIINPDLSADSFYVYCIIIAIVVDLIIMVSHKKSYEIGESALLIAIGGVVVYNIDFMFNNILIGVNEVFSKDISLSGYVIVCVIIAALYEVANAIKIR